MALVLDTYYMQISTNQVFFCLFLMSNEESRGAACPDWRQHRAIRGATEVFLS